LAVLVVNAGSTSLKLHLVEGGVSQPVDSLEVECAAVAHRVVFAGPRLVERPAWIIDGEVERELAVLTPLAPLHNAPMLEALRRARAAQPHVPHLAVLDSYFHRTIPRVAAVYALPARFADIRRYGFHGLSVQWAAEQVAARRLVVCHLGGGCSVTAVLDGRSVDTTMGYTPLEGVPMATRSGSVDPGALLALLRTGRATPEELDRALEHESGLLGLSGISGDVRELEASGEERARLALDVLAYRVAQAVASMAVALGGVEAIAFTGGIGEHAAAVRDAVTAQLGFLRPFAVEVVEAREELVAARVTTALIL
jgi:acetate kinase